MNNIQNYNNEINVLFDKNEPFSLVRIGAMEGFFLEYYFNNISPNEYWYYALYFAAGVYPISDDYLINIWMKETLYAMTNSDIVGFVDIPETIKNNTQFLDAHCKDKSTFFKDDIGVLNPTTLLTIENPWTQKLKGKKVLVVSAFKETIISQWKTINHIWGDNVENIVPFELVDVIRSPFNPVVDSRQYENCNTWDETLDYMCNLISSYDYDVLLVGAGAYSPSLAFYAKITGKIGITLCGDIQLLFGILGDRWKSYSEDDDKKHWIYPLDIDLPENKQYFDQIEKAYWK